jgi:energy-coupling factor transport system substrate-specific component
MLMVIKKISNEKNNLINWTTRDLLITATISIVFAIFFMFATYLYMMFILPLGPLAISAVQGMWFIPPIFIAYIIRRPGAVLLIQSIISIIRIPFSPTGWLMLVIMNLLLVGIPCELVFLVNRYRNYNISILMIAGIVAGLFCTIAMWIIADVNLLSINIQILIIIVSITTGAISGCASKILADTIAKTGVLSGYAVGQKFQNEI